MAVRDAMEALQKAAPNARDYYVQGPDAYKTAMAEHANRIVRLNSVWQELEEIAIHIADQVTP